MTRGLLTLLLALALLLASPQARAASFTISGITFSDELGGFRLISVTGTGTTEDPIIVVEEITGDGPAILVIRTAQNFQDRRLSWSFPSFFSLSIVKVVFNRSGQRWSAFDLELREIVETPSDYSDGLSFGQMFGSTRRLEADRFEGWRQLDEPADRITFFGGSVEEGESARFRFLITDPTRKETFYLLQEPRIVVARALPGLQRRQDARLPSPVSQGGPLRYLVPHDLLERR